MLHRISLLDELRKGGYEASLITTYNAYFPFYEEVVLRRLVNAGVRHNVVMMDANQYAHSFATHPPKLAGRNYTLVPVKVDDAFHPKLVFLAGKKRGLVLVGSHNLTLSGFGFNRELTNLVRIENADDVDGITLARDAWAEIDYWLDNFAAAVPDPVRRMVSRVRDYAPWINGEANRKNDIQLIACRPGKQPLWDQLKNLLGAEAVSVSLTGAFFDKELQFIERVKQDLKPANFSVAVDPNSVQIPPKAQALSNVSFVGAHTLGVDKEIEAGDSRYLHAKGILVVQKNGDSVFASGSANPSAAAWLSSNNSGNVELMLIYRGERARTTADSIGFNFIADMPALNEDDWQAIKSNQKQQAELEPLGYRSGIAVVDETHIMFDQRLLDGVDRPSFVLYSSEGSEVNHTSQYRIESDAAFIEFAETKLTNATALHVLLNGNLVLKLLLHHTREIEEQARSSTQRRFRQALLSLETDTPNIELLIQCIDKIVFSESRETQPSPPKKVGERATPLNEVKEASASLAIDVEDVKRRTSKKQLNHSSDFAYLLDALIYHLRFQKDRPAEEVDSFGRSEEEQIGADDDHDDGQEVSRKQYELLNVCHARVTTVVNRIGSQLKAYAKRQRPLDEVLVRLLGVLAVLRELRKCDGRFAWVERGQTTVPEKQRLRLLEEIMFNLFEGDLSLLHLEDLGAEFRHSDDVARLKGLVLWLAWDCGLTMDLKKPFNESRDDLNERLKRNAMVLMLAQMIQGDDVVEDEARQSIGSLTSSEMRWLKEILMLSHKCETMRDDPSVLLPPERAEPGDIAIHRQLHDWDLRIIAHSANNRINLVKLSNDGELLRYKKDHLAVARLH